MNKGWGKPPTPPQSAYNTNADPPLKLVPVSAYDPTPVPTPRTQPLQEAANTTMADTQREEGGPSKPPASTKPSNANNPTQLDSQQPRERNNTTMVGQQWQVDNNSSSETTTAVVK